MDGVVAEGRWGGRDLEERNETEVRMQINK